MPDPTRLRAAAEQVVSSEARHGNTVYEGVAVARIDLAAIHALQAALTASEGAGVASHRPLRQRYFHEAKFHALTDALATYLVTEQFTAQDLRDATLLAIDIQEHRQGKEAQSPTPTPRREEG